MADRSVVVRLRAEIADYKRQMAEAAKATEGVGTKAKQTGDAATTGVGRLVQSAHQHEQAWGQVGTALLGVGVAATAGVGLAVNKFAEFDEQMSKVQASTHETATNMSLLRQEATDAGAATQFSATEAARGIDELAKAGVGVTDIINGGLDGALALAAAGGLDVGEAAESAASAMTQFGKSGEDVPHIADLLAAAAGKAQGSVEDMAGALKQAGLVADATGLTIEETTGGLAAFASAGLVGSDAGTSFKSMLQRLTPQSAEAQRAMDELGISAYDANGNFIGLSEFAGVLETAMADLTPEARNAAMAVIFGSDAVRASTVLYEQGADGIAEWIDKVNDSGYAAETAALMTNNLRGDLERLGGAFDTALIQSGSAANDILRDTVQAATGAVDAFNGLPQGVQSSALGLAAVVGAAALAGGAFLTLAPRVLETRRAVKQLNTDMPKLGKGLNVLARAGAVAGGLYVAATATSALVEAMTQGDAEQGSKAIERGLRDIAKSGADVANLDKQFQNFGTFLGENVSNVNSLDDALAQLAGTGGTAFDQATDSITGFIDGFPGLNSYLEKSEARFAGLDSTLAGMVSGGSVDAAREAFHQIAERAEEQGVSIEELTALFPEYSDAMIGAEDAQNQTAAATIGTSDAMDEQIDKLGELASALADAAGIVLSEREAQRELEAAYDGVTESIEQQIEEIAAIHEANGLGAEAARARAEAEVAAADKLDINTEAGRRNQAALDDVAGSTWDLITSMQENGATQEELQATMETSRQRFIDAATQLGLTADEANVLADELGLIPANVTTEVNLGGNASGLLDSIQSKLTGLTRRDGFTITTNLVTNEITRRTSDPLATVARAWGGPVFGPGTETSDSIAARLSHNEHVWSAAEVKGAGGHAAVASLRERARRGTLPGFAGGGSPGWTPGAAASTAVAATGLPEIITLLDVDGSILARTRVIAHRAAVGVVHDFATGDPT